jgi:hypothetical protein
VDVAVGAEHVVVGQQVVEAEVAHTLDERADGVPVRPDLGLREDGPEADGH